jgi:hypothetical protein
VALLGRKPMPGRGAWARVLSLAAAAGATGCAPTYDWREVRLEGSALVSIFPCRPQNHVRTTELAGMQVPMQLHVCSSGQETWAIAVLDVAQPAQVTAALQALRRAALANFSATLIRTSPLQVPGMTPNPNAALEALQGVSPQGASIQATAAFFAKGLRVYQATVFAPRVSPEASEMFFSGLKLQ